MNRAIHDQSWLLWQLADSAFPTGGFAHSGGLEAAWQSGEIPDTAALGSFLESSLQQLASSMIPFVAAAHRAPDQLSALDRDCDAFLSNHVANRASRLQGRAFAQSALRIFGHGPPAETPFCHFAPTYGAIANSLGLSAAVSVELFAFQTLRGWIAAAVRLGVAGPLEAQAMQFRLIPRARQILDAAKNITLDQIATTAPLLEIWQGGQDRLYSRLFQS